MSNLTFKLFMLVSKPREYICLVPDLYIAAHLFDFAANQMALVLWTLMAVFPIGKITEPQTTLQAG